MRSETPSDSQMLFHYTTGDRLTLILRDGLVRPATAYVPSSETPVVWLSANPDFEPTAVKGCVDAGGYRVLGLWEMAQLGGGLVRLGLSVAKAKRRKFLPWPFCAVRARMDQHLIQGLGREGIKQGANPSHWWGGPAIPVHVFDVIEVRDSVDAPWSSLPNSAA